MTTYELPPEPPIGESVQDVHGRTWKHEGVNRWELKGDDYADDPETRSWHRVLLSEPLTLIEPDPWPTEPLIVADWQDGYETQGRGLLVADGPTPSECYVVLTGDDDYDGYRLLRHKWDGDTLHNVVPVTVVPVAEMRHAREMLAAADAGDFDSFIGSFRKLIAATDALGVDQ